MKTDDLITRFMGFTDGSTEKVRPLYVAQTNDVKVLVFKITSKCKNKPDHTKRMYFPILEWKAAGLDKPSYIDLYSSSRWLMRDELIPIIGHLTDDVLRLKTFVARSSLNY